MNSCNCCTSERVMSRHERAMKCLENSSTVPVRYSMANSPMGLSVSGGPNRAFTSCTNWVHVGHPPLSSIRWNQSCASSSK
jgi:hypothetical protein